MRKRTDPRKGADPKDAPRRRCTARRRSDGKPCGNAPIRGGNVCRLHGGSAPQTRAAAHRRILAAADLAAAQLIDFMVSRKVPYNVRLAAARDLLDRASVTGRSEVEVSIAPWQEALDGIAVDVEVEPTRPEALALTAGPEPVELPAAEPVVLEPVPPVVPLRRKVTTRPPARLRAVLRYDSAD